ncbi:hypothetical protein LY78DRAFT_730 [Colletotrichum sublineola]|nr:hypothetical protein LY78DRAFT_730 [Colletotrichum sublineola]
MTPPICAQTWRALALSRSPALSLKSSHGVIRHLPIPTKKRSYSGFRAQAKKMPRLAVQLEKANQSSNIAHRQVARPLGPILQASQTQPKSKGVGKGGFFSKEKKIEESRTLKEKKNKNHSCRLVVSRRSPTKRKSFCPFDEKRSKTPPTMHGYVTLEPPKTQVPMECAVSSANRITGTL